MKKINTIKSNNKLDLINQNYNSVAWIKEIDSWIDWHNLCISVCTHWWEHAWLKAVEYLYEIIDIQKELIKWRIFFILVNIQAYKKSLEYWNIIPEEFRFIDENLNRCCSTINIQKSVSYEVKRAIELTPLLSNVDYHLDIHSTYSPKSEAILITSNKSKEISNIFNIDVIYSWLINAQVGVPLIDITQRFWWIWIWLEAWYEKDKDWFKIWVENSLRLLTSLWMIKDDILNNLFDKLKENKNMNIYSSIIVSWKNFSPIKDFKHWEIIKAWNTIAYNWNKEIKLDRDSYILFPAPILRLWEEYCFLWEVE